MIRTRGGTDRFEDLTDGFSSESLCTESISKGRTSVKCISCGRFEVHSTNSIFSVRFIFDILNFEDSNNSSSILLELEGRSSCRSSITNNTTISSKFCVSSSTRSSTRITNITGSSSNFSKIGVSLVPIMNFTGKVSFRTTYFTNGSSYDSWDGGSESFITVLFFECSICPRSCTTSTGGTGIIRISRKSKCNCSTSYPINVLTSSKRYR